MELINASHTRPFTPPTPPPSTNPIISIPEPTSTWAGKQPPSTDVAAPSPDVGSDDIACVLNVEDLQPGFGNMKESPVAAFLQAALGRPPAVEAISCETFVHGSSYGIRTNMLLAAIDVCFQDHHPLGLRPEVLWVTIMTQVAAEVKANAGAYQAMFTTSTDKQALQVRHDGLRLGSPYGWDVAIGMFEEPLLSLIPSGVGKMALAPFSTSGATERLTTLIALMDAASPYYDYRVMTRCGIPKVALFGTAEDWQNLAKSTREVAGLFPTMADYFAKIMPTIDKIVATVQGDVSERDPFWKSIYKRNSESGGDKLTGWITDFYAYLTDYEGVTSRRSFAPQSYDRGYSPAAFPSSVSKVPFTWDYFGTKLPMTLVGGVLTTQDINGFMAPRLGWAVVHAD